ncbi:peptide ABC transporter permease [Microvirga flavescens]|uniref:peptide ABC transporter permease n=1 Tax=Microvirga flavescens TaxID=2249811 RepID=UPI000DD8C6A1|nr:peptide ABC transporter permease [Microvirga flavescens]
MPRIPSQADPSSDAAAILRRLGFALLFFVGPVAVLFARRAIVILGPVAIILLVLAALLDGSSRASRQHLARLVRSPGGIAGFVLLLWTALSLIWTPFLPEATERLFNLIGMVVLAAAGYLALPDRMRSANLYMLSVGIAVAAIAASIVPLLGMPHTDLDEQNFERGLTLLTLFAWPAVTWLHSRDRNLEAILLAVAVAVATVLAPGALPLQGLAAGAAIFAVTAISPAFGARFTALVMTGLVLLAPAIPFLLKPFAGPLDHESSLAIWRSVIIDEPLRLVTGHGLETALRGRFAGLLAPSAPSTFLFEVWYELGLVGAAASAIVLYTSATGAVGERPLLVPGIMATFASAFALGCLGIGTAQAWWFTALVVTMLMFVAIERGQFRTRRPKATFLRRERPLVPTRNPA